MNSVIQKLTEQYQGKNVLVVGLGLQGGGVGVARFFSKLGSHVTVTDKKDRSILIPSIDKLSKFQITYHLGKDHDVKDFIQADLIIKGPYVSWNLHGLIEAEKKRIPVDMELSFFAKYCPAKIIGITGTRGKSTTTNMIYWMLKNQGYKVHIGGSLPGISTINMLYSIKSDEWIVMELPSWPLSGFYRAHISPHIAVFTNLYPDHLNYYESMDIYAKDKKAIYLHQKNHDHLIVNKSLQLLIQHDFIKSTIHYFSKEDWKFELEHITGDHNKENASAALIIAKLLKINLQKAIRAISSFKGLAYRQQIIREYKNVIFINDTTSTTPVATEYAILNFSHTNKKIYLLLGGNAKKLPVDHLLDLLQKVEKIILLKGSFIDGIISQLQLRYPEKITEVYDDLKKATNKAYEFAKKTGGYVLFSPSATSFSLFNNEFHRGEEFNTIVKNIK